MDETTAIGVDGLGALGRVVGVWAHPDDEAYLAAGLMAAICAGGGWVASICATAGEAGGGEPAATARLRRRELADALALLGVAEHVVLDHPDGGCAAVDPEAAADYLAHHLDRLRPDTIVTFGPDGITGHADHRTVSRWVDLATERTRARARVLHATSLAEPVARFADVAEEFGVYEPGLPVTTPVAELAVHLELAGPLLDRKLAALAAHASQTTAIRAALGPDRYAEWVATEAFRAAPAPRAVTPRSSAGVPS
jgi:LmbE family N-acetylglucosaminyl deacetylase